jgi:hypothetical protein
MDLSSRTAACVLATAWDIRIRLISVTISDGNRWSTDGAWPGWPTRQPAIGLGGLAVDPDVGSDEMGDA